MDSLNVLAIYLQAQPFASLCIEGSQVRTQSTTVRVVWKVINQTAT